ncbi:MAG: reverse transcriptase/maturase family protein [Candidatus Magasanikbacteria bacterium]
MIYQLETERYRVRDRLVHHAIYRVLYPFFERTFIGDSYSCRIDKGTHKAIGRFQALAYKVSHNHTRTCWVLKCDIRKFFASIDHEILLEILSGYIPNKDIMRLLGEVVGSFTSPSAREGVAASAAGGVGASTSATPPEPPLGKRGIAGVGLPLGNLTSQLFANVYMNVFDQFVKHQLEVRHYIRYADDFVFLSEDKFWLKNLLPQIKTFLFERLKLTLHPDKVFLQTITSGVDFLGWVIFTDHRVLRGTTKSRMSRRIVEHPTSETLQSYLGMLRWGNGEKTRAELLNRFWEFSEPVAQE